ncbi:MAG: sulfite exporter TauE/SafE family protein [Microcystaceae cyanobacterium]
MEQFILLWLSGIFAGLLAGLMGIGGGTVLVPILVFFQHDTDRAVATSTLAIVMTSLSGTIQNWRMGYIDTQRVLAIAIPSLFTAQIGVYLADKAPSNILLMAFGSFLIINIFLSSFRRQLASQEADNPSFNLNPILGLMLTGGSAGILAGLFGIGGGVIIVPFQMIFLKEPIKVAIQTSLGVIIITALSACVGHAFKGNVLWTEGLILGLGGLMGAQVSTRFLPKLPDKVVVLCFNGLLTLLAIFIFRQATN